MNKHIERIAGQVLDEVVPETWVALGYDKVKEIQRRTAELIVKEMCDVFDKKAKPGTGFYEPHEPSELIKEHFGVEE